MRRLLLLLLFLLLNGTCMATSAVAREAGVLRPDEVVVIANSESEDSLRVARHYMAKRDIPKHHLFTFAYPEFGDLEPMDKNPAWYPYAEFRSQVVEPLETFLTDRDLKQKVLCLVTVYGTPYRVGRFELTDEQEQALLREIDEDAEGTLSEAERDERLKKAKHQLWLSNKAFDSELALLFGPQTPPAAEAPLAGMRSRMNAKPNAFFDAETDFRSFREQQLQDGEAGLLYMVARLDGETPEIAMGLVDKAMAAEEAGGLKGRFCLDARNEGPDRRGYNQGDWWIRQAHDILTDAGMEGVYDTRGKPLPANACEAPAIYWGFYHPFDYRGEIFGHRFATGAIGCELASFEAARLWKGETDDDKGGPWVPGMLNDGVTVAIGPVAEPYLHAFPETQIFFPRLLSGWSVGQAYWASIRHRSWRMIIIGDPMYQPFPS